MYIIIDGKEIAFSESDKNIVDVAAKAGIGIPAPCYRKKPRNSCCKVCVIEIDNKQAYACCTQPREGMNIILNRDDLKNLRKERIRLYRESPNQEGCDCSCDCSSDSSGGDCCC